MRGRFSAAVAALTVLGGWSAFYALNKSMVDGAYYRHVAARGLSEKATGQLAEMDSFRDCAMEALCPEWLPEMVVIPEGDFLMGSESDEADVLTNDPFVRSPSPVSRRVGSR